MRTIRRHFLILPLLVCLPSISNAKLFVPDADLWPIWDAADEGSRAAIDHSGWQALLDVYLQTDHPAGINLFNYANVTSKDREGLRTYIDGLTRIDPRHYNRAEQLAYWINLYNAVTVDLILQHYPVKSIRQIYGGLLRLGPWKKEIIEVAGEKLTLNDIEHRILRPIYQDPRIHYAVNCASLGCPNLFPRAYTGDNSDELLDAGARAYVNHPRGVQFVKGRLTVSSIYNWFEVDFGANKQGVIEHLATYSEPALAEQLKVYRGRLKYDYDWKLNAP